MKKQFHSNKETFVAASRKIKYYEPFQRLYLRKVIEDILKQVGTIRIDVFAIFDAVAKRGGFSKVDSQNRWQQIGLSLPYYKYDFRSKYKQLIQPKQNQVYSYLRQFKKQYRQQTQSFVEFHLLSMSNPYGYYHVQDQSFSKHNFPNIDVYLNIRTICVYKPKLERIIVQYADKFCIMRKNMLMYGQTRPFYDKQLETLQLINKNDGIKVALVGWSISTLIAALRLKQFNIDHILYTNLLDSSQMNEANLMAQQGIFMLQDSPYSYEKRLKQYGVQIQQIPQNSCFLDEQGIPISSKKIRQSQEVFCSLLSQLKNQQNNKRNLYTQMQYIAQKKKLSIQNKLLKWHFQRYFMLNQLRGDYTTVSEMNNYLMKRKFRIFLKRRKAYYIKDCSKLLQKVKSEIKIVTQSIKSIQYKGIQWTMSTKDQQKLFTHLIFAEPETIAKAIINSNYRISYIEDNFPVLYQLNFIKYICCKYKFTEKVKTKHQIQEKAIQTEHNNGHIFFYIINDGYQVMAVSKISSSNVSKSILYAEILAILQNRVLQTLPQMVDKQTQNCSYGYSFPVKEQSAKDRITRLKSKQKMYLSLSYGTNLSISRLSSQIDTNNYIIGLIMGHINNISAYDKNLLDLFDHSYEKKYEELNCKNPVPSLSSSSKKQNQNNTEIQRIYKKSKIEIQSLVSRKIQNQILYLPIQSTFKFLPNFEQINQKLNKMSQMTDQNTKTLQSQFDPFGFLNPVIQNYVKYLRKNCQFQKNSKNKIQKNLQILKYLQWNNLQEPITLSKGLMLHSFGQTFFVQPKIKQNLSNKQQISNKEVKMCLFDGYLTRRQYYCLQKHYKTTIYVQCVIYIQNIPYFVIFDEYFPTTIYYHTDLIALTNLFNQRIQQQKIQCHSNQSKLNRIKMKAQISSNIYLSQIKNLIQDELNQNRTKSLNQILKDKFSGKFKNKRLKNPQTMEQNCQLLIKKLQNFLEIQIKNYFLRPLSLVDVFFGYLNEQYLIFQIMNQSQMNIQKIQQLDPELYQQIQKIYTNEKKNEDFQLIIHHQTEKLIIYREFLAGKNDFDCESINKKYILIKEYQLDKFNSPIFDQFRCSLMKGINSQRIQIKNSEQPMKQIILSLLPTWTSQQIYQQIQRLIRKQLLNEFSLTPKLKIYFQMTRRQINLLSQSEINLIIQKNKNLQEEQRTEISQNIQSQNIMFVNGQYVFLGY